MKNACERLRRRFQTTTTRHLVAYCLVILSCSIALGQSETQRSDLKISGRVTENGGTIVPGVQVRAKAPGIRLARSGITNESGYFVISGLVPGQYMVEVKVEPLTAVQEVNLTSDRTLEPLVMQPDPALAPRYEGVGADISAELPAMLAVIEKKKRQITAEYAVERLWGWSTKPLWTEVVNNQASDEVTKQRRLTKQLHDLGQEGLDALLLGLQDPDVQMRRNSALMLLDLAGGFSMEARPRLQMRETQSNLKQSLTDSDELVRHCVNQTIQEVQRNP